MLMYILFTVINAMYSVHWDQTTVC